VGRYGHANGNMAIRNKGLAKQQTLSWNAENRQLDLGSQYLREMPH
jgi:hypothetical protein